MRAVLFLALCAFASAISPDDPVPGDVEAQTVDEPDGPHTSEAWRIWAYSRAAPKYLASGATVMEGEKVLRKGTNGWTCLPANPRGMTDKTKGWASAHESVPVCADANAMDWVGAYIHGKSPEMKGDGWAWMLMGDMGEDNNVVGKVADWKWGEEHPDNWIQSGSHLMLMPKNADLWKDYTSDFTKGGPYVMFQKDPKVGDKYAHIMIPCPNYYAYQTGASPALALTSMTEPEGPHTSKDWKIWAYSSAAPAFLAGGVKVVEMDAKGKMVPLFVPKTWNGFTCLPANPHGPADPKKGWANPHEAMPLCGDGPVFAWVAAYFKQKKPAGMKADGFAWMLHGDMGEDNHKVGMVGNYTHAKANQDAWIQSGPHLMLMPKDADAWKTATMDFTTGDPYMMFEDDKVLGNMYSHVMIPMPGYFHYENDHHGLNPTVPPPSGYWWMKEKLAMKFQVIQGGKILQDDGTPSTLLMTVVGAIMLTLLLARLWIWRGKFQAAEVENAGFNKLRTQDMELGGKTPCPE